MNQTEFQTKKNQDSQADQRTTWHVSYIEAMCSSRVLNFEQTAFLFKLLWLCLEVKGCFNLLTILSPTVWHARVTLHVRDC